MRIKCYHKNGDKADNRLENLKVCDGYTKQPTSEQLDVFNKEAFACCLHIFKTKGWLKQRELDVDNILGDTYLLIYKHLPQYNPKYSFLFLLFTVRPVDLPIHL